MFSHGRRKKEEGRKEEEEPTPGFDRREDPTGLKFGGCLVGVLRLSGGCLDGVWIVPRGYLEVVYWMSKWSVVCLDGSEGQVRTG